VVAEQTPVPAGTGGIFRALVPERTVEDVLASRLRMRFGEQEFVLKVLTIEESDHWRDQVEANASDVLERLGGEANAAGLLTFMGMQTPLLLGLIHEYDVHDILPDDVWLKRNATEPEVLKAFILCVVAAYPFVAAVLEILAANPQALKLVLEEFSTPTSQTGDGKPTTTLPVTTGGRSRKSAGRSQTSSSQAT
jgi:hypothetical protein